MIQFPPVIMPFLFLSSCMRNYNSWFTQNLFNGCPAQTGPYLARDIGEIAMGATHRNKIANIWSPPLADDAKCYKLSFKTTAHSGLKTLHKSNRWFKNHR